MKVGKAVNVGFEPDCAVSIVFAEQVETKAGDGHVVRRKREPLSLRSSSSSAAGGFEDEVKKLGERKAELASVIGDEV
jgi:hypothetical protein